MVAIRMRPARRSVAPTNRSSPTQSSPRRSLSASLSSLSRRFSCCRGLFAGVLLVTALGAWNLYSTQLESPTWIEIDASFEARNQRRNRNNGSPTEKQHDDIDVDGNPDHVPIRQPTHTACASTDGVYHIGIADIEGGVGTALFQLVIAQIHYAKMTLNLTPWVHFLPNISRVIDDPVIHGTSNDDGGVSLMVGRVANVSRIRGLHKRDVVPGPLLAVDNDDDTASHSSPRHLHFGGTGIWGHYLQPVSDFVPGDTSCQSKLYVTLSINDIRLVIPGLHGYSYRHHAVPCWRYDYLPVYVTRPHQSYFRWMEEPRRRAAAIVEQHFHYRPYLIQRARAANPNCHGGSSGSSIPQRNLASAICLGLHIRHSDKAAGRRVVATSEFLPYVEAFVQSTTPRPTKSGQQQPNNIHIYIATDSSRVLHEIQTTWPAQIVTLIRSDATVIRSNDTTAVFDPTVAASTTKSSHHHITNQDAIVEILALSYCHFLVHGHSAVSEAAIWNNIALHETSVNLEDEHRSNASQFATLVELATDVSSKRIPKSQWPRPTHREDEWPPPKSHEMAQQTRLDEPLIPTHHACDGYNGVLKISTVGRNTEAVGGFFTSILNQLLYAQQYNLVPWIHLTNATLLFDPKVHHHDGRDSGRPRGTSTTTFTMMKGMVVAQEKHDAFPNSLYPGQPTQQGKLQSEEFVVPPGNGIWATYFEPVSDFVPGDKSCRVKPLLEMSESLVAPGIDVFRTLAIKNENTPVQPLPNGVSLPISNWLMPQRSLAQDIVKKYFRFQPFILDRAAEVNPATGAQQPCLGIHVRSHQKRGKYRQRVKPDDFLPYLEAFARAGGRTIYVATDAERPLRYMANNFPAHVTAMFRTQGEHIVRSPIGDTGIWGTHELDDRHRVNSETLVDVVALSQCAFLVHGISTMSEAAIYVNPMLQNQSVNLEDPERMSPEAFESLVRDQTGVNGVNETLPLSLVTATTATNQETERLASIGTTFEEPRVLYNQHSKGYCQSTNAIVYLAQKVHSSYSRDSYSSLLRSIELLSKNYLSLNHHHNNTDVFIFHTGDFNSSDLAILESSLNVAPSGSGGLYLVDLSNTTFWARPKANANDDPKSWYAYPLFSEGYRRMMHWFAIDVWDFFAQWNERHACDYRYIWRLDEDSFLHSPIDYDVFDFMSSHRYVYGFRMCAYEMKVTRPMTTMWLKQYPNFQPQREISLETCGFYNNLFVADLHFFRSPKVSEFLAFIDKRGHIYKRRLGDLMIQSMAVYWFAEQDRIHRFLDFTYEHGTRNHSTGCLKWGGIQAGFNDAQALETLAQFKETMTASHCQFNEAWLGESDLSPTYAHVPSLWKGNVSLQTVTAGDVELPQGKGLLSG